MKISILGVGRGRHSCINCSNKTSLSVNYVAAFWRAARRRSEYSIKLQVPWNDFTLPSSPNNWYSAVQLQTEAESKAGMETAPQPCSSEVRWVLLTRKVVEAIEGNVIAFLNRENTGVALKFGPYVMFDAFPHCSKHLLDFMLWFHILEIFTKRG